MGHKGNHWSRFWGAKVTHWAGQSWEGAGHRILWTKPGEKQLADWIKVIQKRRERVCQSWISANKSISTFSTRLCIAGISEPPAAPSHLHGTWSLNVSLKLSSPSVPWGGSPLWWPTESTGQRDLVSNVFLRVGRALDYNFKRKGRFYVSLPKELLLSKVKCASALSRRPGTRSRCWVRSER